MATVMFQEKAKDFNEIVFHYKSAIRNYATFSGRMSRRAFWYFYGSIAMVSAVSLSVDSLLETDVFFPLTVLFHIVPHFSALVRRLHDVGYPTWVVIPCAVPLIGFVFAAMGSENGPNEYGPPPAPYSPQPPQTPKGMAQPLQAYEGPRGSAACEPPIEKLERLAELRSKGVITDAEFDQMKRRLMGTNPT
ncbi:DUF805 domain-containing protein [Mesorhizobium sp. PL10]